MPPAKTQTKTVPVEKPEPTKVMTPQEQLAKYLNATKEDHYNHGETPQRYILSSGSLGLDSEGVMFAPGAYRVAGGPNLGKTPFLLNVADTLLDEVPNSRVLWCLCEGRLSDQNKARARHPIVYDAEQWKEGTIFVFKTNVFDTFVNLMRDCIVNNPTNARYGFFMDSVDNAILKSDLAKDITEAGKVAGAPALTKKLFQRVGLAMRERGHWAFFISQRTSAPKIDPYAPTEPRQIQGSGGNSLAHNADDVIEFQEYYQSDLILEKPDEKPDRLKNRALGHNIRIRIGKSSSEKRFTTVEIPIKHGVSKGSAIWKEREIGDMMLGFGLVTKAGSWLTLTDTLKSELSSKSLSDIPDKVQGLNQLYSFLESRPDVTTYLFTRFKEMISGKAATV